MQLRLQILSARPDLECTSCASKDLQSLDGGSEKAVGHGPVLNWGAFSARLRQSRGRLYLSEPTSRQI